MNETVSLSDFRDEVRRFVQTKLPDDIRESVEAKRPITRDQAQRWQKILSSAGWGAPGWPVEYGGTGWPLVKQATLQEELLLSGAPATENLGLGTIGPTIIRHGTAAQKDRFLNRIVNFDDYWAQAYSEPGAGSDLASLSCSAKRNGDHYVVNGTKIWQSHGYWSNWALALVRTTASQRKQDGISVLLIDLKAPGVTVRPIKFINGTNFHVQIFFDDVKVPVDNRIGNEGEGWSIAKGLLITERLFTGRVPECKTQLASIKKLAKSFGPDGSNLGAQPWYSRQIAELEIRLTAFESAWWQNVERAQRGEDLGAEVLKLRLIGGALLQDLHGMQLQIVGSDGLLVNPASLKETGKPVGAGLALMHAENVHIQHFRFRGISLGTGSAEVQRDLVARDILDKANVGDRTAAGTEDEAALVDMASRFVERDYPFERRRGIIASSRSFEPAVWQGMADVGILGILAPAEDGGIGGNIRDVTLVAEEFGKALLIEPYLSTTVAGVQIALANPSSANISGLSVSKMAAGQQKVAFAYLEAGARHDAQYIRTVAAEAGNQWTLSGKKLLVWGGETADKVLVTARLKGPSSDVGIFCLDAGDIPGASHLKSYNDRTLSEYTFDNLQIPSAALLVQGQRAEALIEKVVDSLTLCICAEAIGAMDRGLAITMDYMKTRKQFGKSIAEFQALRHRLVEHSLALYNTRSLVRIASQAFLQNDAAQQRRTTSAAKFYAGRAARQIGHDILQLHGAVGFQDETAISHYGKFLVSFDAMFGDFEFQMSRFLANPQKS